MLVMLAMLLQSAGAYRQPELPRLLGPALAECVDEDGCHVDGSRRYRLETRPRIVEDSMERAMRGVWQPCETTGAPVCPSKGGALVFRAEIEPN